MGAALWAAWGSGMKEITLSGGHVVKVDDDKLEMVMRYHWTFAGHYARTTIRTDEKKKGVYMHRLLIDAPSGSLVDHINGDRLDNRLVNLRLASRSENGRNRIHSRTSRSKVKGVHFSKAARKWSAEIWVNYKKHYLGLFETIETAAAAYNKASEELHGEFGYEQSKRIAQTRGAQ